MSRTPSPQDNTNVALAWQFALFFGLALFILFQAPLRESLWLDEAVTFWVTNGTLGDAAHRSYHYQGMSPVYFVLLWYWRQVIGHGELALRLPSILATAASCGFLYAIARELFNKHTALLAITFFICQDVTQKLALSARPYAAAVMCALWSVYALLAWLRRGERSSQFEYVFASLLTIYFQYLFAPLLLIHVLIIMAIAPHDRAKIRKFFFVLLPCIALLLIPGFYQLSLLAQKSNSMKFMIDRGIGDLLLAIFPMNILAYLCIALLFSFVYDRFHLKKIQPGENRFLVVLAVWIVFPALWLFVYSRISAGSVFVDRFYAWAAPACALLLAWVIARIEPARARRNIFLVFMLMAGLREVQHQWNVEDWKSAARKASEAAAPDAPLFVYSGLIESEQILWYADAEKAAFLRAPFAVYPTSREAILLPGSFENPAAAQYVQDAINRPQAKLSHFVLISLHIKHEVQPGVWQPVDEYMTQYFEQHGFKAHKLEDKNLVRVIAFERTGT